MAIFFFFLTVASIFCRLLTQELQLLSRSLHCCGPEKISAIHLGAKLRCARL